MPTERRSQVMLEGVMAAVVGGLIAAAANWVFLLRQSEIQRTEREHADEREFDSRQADLIKQYMDAEDIRVRAVLLELAALVPQRGFEARWKELLIKLSD